MELTISLGLRAGIFITCLCLGAVILDAIEKEATVDPQATKTQVSISSFFIQNITKTFQLNTTNSQFTSLFRDIESYIDRTKQTSGSGLKTSFSQDGVSRYVKWLYATFTAMTTIGYGDVVPSTEGGKGFLTFYMITCVPLTMSLLASMANVFTSLQVQGLKNLQAERRLFSKKMIFILPMLINSLFLVVYLMIGAIITHQQLNWDFTSSLYFWVATMTTTGFGDVTLYGSIKEQWYILGWSLYIFIGLISVACVVASIYQWHEKRGSKEDEEEKPVENPIADVQLRRYNENYDGDM